MANPNNAIKNNPYSAPQFYYPLDLGAEGREPYVIFDIRDGVAKNAQSKGTVALYMPPDVKASYRACYEDRSMGIFGFDPNIKDILNSASNSFEGAASGAMDSASGASVGGAGGMINGIGSVGREALYALAVNSSARAQRDFRQIVNPHQAVLFKGMGLRTFNLNFILVAKSPEESDMIRNIIYTFKYHMHPGYPADTGNQRYLLYPENFVIGFFSPSPNYLFSTSPCVLEGCDVDYAGAGPTAFYASTGAPVQVNLSLSFKETEVLTKERIKEGA